MDAEGISLIPPKRFRFKLNRLYLIVSVVCLGFVTCFYHYADVDFMSVYLSSAKRVIGEHYPEDTIITEEPEALNTTATTARFTRSTTKSGDEAEHVFKLTSFYDIKPSNENIFFIESRCGLDAELKKHSPHDGVVFNARQICAIESTAAMNPTRPVYMLHTCPLDDNFFANSPKYFQQFWLAHPNLHMVQLNMSDMFENSTVESLYYEKKFEQSHFPVAHQSDVMRLIALYKFGGTYMDIDVMSIKSLDKLGVNFAGWQDNWTIATGVMNFAYNGFGHEFLAKYLKTFKDEYNPQSWSGNGPEMFTRLLIDVCTNDALRIHCDNFTAYAKPIFYPIYYTRWRFFFNEADCDFALSQLKQTYIIHFWNQMSSKEKVKVGSKQAYAVLAAKYCPKSYHNCGDTF